MGVWAAAVARVASKAHQRLVQAGVGVGGLGWAGEARAAPLGCDVGAVVEVVAGQAGGGLSDAPAAVVVGVGLGQGLGAGPGQAGELVQAVPGQGGGLAGAAIGGGAAGAAGAGAFAQLAQVAVVVVAQQRAGRGGRAGGLLHLRELVRGVVAVAPAGGNRAAERLAAAVAEDVEAVGLGLRRVAVGHALQAVQRVVAVGLCLRCAGQGADGAGAVAPGVVAVVVLGQDGAVAAVTDPGQAAFGVPAVAAGQARGQAAFDEAAAGVGCEGDGLAVGRDDGGQAADGVVLVVPGVADRAGAAAAVQQLGFAQAATGAPAVAQGLVAAAVGDAAQALGGVVAVVVGDEQGAAAVTGLGPGDLAQGVAGVAVLLAGAACAGDDTALQQAVEAGGVGVAGLRGR